MKLHSVELLRSRIYWWYGQSTLVKMLRRAYGVLGTQDSDFPEETERIRNHVVQMVKESLEALCRECLSPNLTYRINTHREIKPYTWHGGSEDQLVLTIHIQIHELIGERYTKIANCTLRL